MKSLVALFLLAAVAAAQGIVVERIIIDPPPPRPPEHFPVRLKEHRIQVRIADGVATTDVTQVFHNPNPWPVEGTYLFPLPEGSAVSDFTMSMGGKQVKGEVLDAARAREIYRSIVHRQRDPGLLEYAGRGLIRASLFPIPPRGDVTVTLSIGQALRADGDLAEYVYPLRSDRFGPPPVNVAVSVEVEASAGIATFFSPTHRLDVVRKGENRVIASFEEPASRADRDFRLLFSSGRKDFGLALTTHRPPGEDGTFLLLVAPRADAARAEALPKDVVFVLDTSGSMGDRGGGKLRQAKAALAYALGRLDPKDRFNVVPFATEARPFREGVVEATPENVAAALELVKGLEATGGTAIHDALVQALRLGREAGRVPIVLFLTDGRPTIGPSEPAAILEAVQKANAASARLFVFGVGDDVNTVLLTELAEGNRGSDHFVSENEDIEVKVSTLVDRIASPVLTDVTVSIDGALVHDVYPRQAGDLFRGQQLLLVGRYRQPGHHAITLTGRIGEREVQFVYEASFGEGRGHDFLPRLWAVRKVGFLLSEIRRHGEQPELVDEVRRLGTRHGIVTPYTSFLVVEEQELERRRFDGGPGAPAAPADRRQLEASLRELDDALEEAKAAGEALGGGVTVGRGAVSGAKKSVELKEADRAEALAGKGVRHVDGKTFRLVDGVWTDLDLEAFRKDHPDAEVRKIAYLGEEWDRCLEDAELARCLSVGERVTFVHGGVVYEVG